MMPCNLKHTLYRKTIQRENYHLYLESEVSIKNRIFWGFFFNLIESTFFAYLTTTTLQAVHQTGEREH